MNSFNTYTINTNQVTKTALITGITGQDGSYLAEWLLYRGYRVVGLVRRASTDNLSRIAHILPRIIIKEGDITDAAFVCDLVHRSRFDEIYNLAAQSHVQTSFTNPVYTYQVNTIGLLNILNAVLTGVRDGYTSPKIYQASSSEMFGNSQAPQSLIDTQLRPVSPYACSKVAAHELVSMYRDVYGMYAVSGVLFNHESPRRGEKFVTRKITKYFSNPDNWKQPLLLGNIQTERDWGFAPDYVQVMWQALQHESPRDFVLGTGKTYSISQFLDKVGEYVGVDCHDFVSYNNGELMRDCDVVRLRAISDYGVRTDLDHLIKIMIDYDRNWSPGYTDTLEGYEYYREYYGDIYAWRT